MVGADGSLANIANILACGFSVGFVVFLIWITSRRKAAVGELLIFKLGLFAKFPQLSFHVCCGKDGTRGPLGQRRVDRDRYLASGLSKTSVFP